MKPQSSKATIQNGGCGKARPLATVVCAVRELRWRGAMTVARLMGKTLRLQRINFVFPVVLTYWSGNALEPSLGVSASHGQ
jgi:hypothetical protein